MTAKVRVSDDFNHVSVAEVTLYPGDLGPPERLDRRARSGPRMGGRRSEFDYEAVATDPDGETFAVAGS